MDMAGYARACFLLRDVHANKVFPMDPHLLDILCGLQRWGAYNGRDSHIGVLSGFRTLTTNGSTEGAALNSRHLSGAAADILLDGFSSGLMGAMAKEFNDKGGTGIYLSRGFVHVDTGPGRTWVSTAQRRAR